ncbi:MAG: BamA/TamA family outer membrane protein, partial [Flavobacteriales bacterium]
FLSYKGSRLLMIALASLLLLASCRPTRRLAEEEYLLDRNHIKVEEKDSLRFSPYKLRPVIKQKPNKRILGFIRFHLAVHNIANNGNDSSKVRNWLMNEVGEAPVVFDTAATGRTVHQMETYLTKRGYFRAKVRDSVVLTDEKRSFFDLIPYKRQRAEVYYFLEPGPLYHFDSIHYDLDEGISSDGAQKIREESTLQKGQPFDIGKLEKERRHLTEKLRKRGFYTFTKNAIRFKLDSSVGDRKVAVELEVRPKALRKGGKDSVVTHPHRSYQVRDIIVHTDHDPRREKSSEKTDKDTLVVDSAYRFIYHDELQIDPSLLIQTIYIKPDDNYNSKREEQTYRRLSEMQAFRSVKISYKAVKSKERTLDCTIRLGRVKTHSLSLESRGTNQGGNLGISGNITYKNRNMFQGSETFTADLNGGVESQNELTQEEAEKNNVISGLQLNTIEFGPELSLDFPKFLLPVDPKRFARSSDPRTRFSASMNFQQRPSYKRNVTSMSMSYRWDETELKKHRVNPIELSMIRIDKSRAFQRRLEAFNDRLLLNSYQDHFIFGSSYSYSYNSQEHSDQDNITFFKGNFETAGNTLHYLHRKSNAKKGPNDQYRIANIAFAQFMKGSADLRFYHHFNSKSSVAFRIFGGVGVPYGNSAALPFQRSFYGGGANGIRAWKIRTLGPGSFTDSTFSLSFDKIGDIKLEGNVEYRFDLIDPVEGAFFLDAGNIWLLEKNEKRPGGYFEKKDFVNEIAYGGGIGLRLDLNFFIVRLDFGIPLKDPQLPVGERWIFQPKKRIDAARKKQAKGDPNRSFDPYHPLDKIKLNLGIGYPF